MLWNWYTVDSCFIASTWHITSEGMFAGSCIGVILLTMSLEFMRRTVKEYDRYLIRKNVSAASADSNSDSSPKPDSKLGLPGGYRPTIFEQAIRALLHMVQFAVAYFIML
jgi:solute carrier family 31 (copper transporter), member 1